MFNFVYFSVTQSYYIMEPFAAQQCSKMEYDDMHLGNTILNLTYR